MQMNRGEGKTTILQKQTRSRRLDARCCRQVSFARTVCFPCSLLRPNSTHHSDDDRLPVTDAPLHPPAAVGAGARAPVLVNVELVVVSLTGQQGASKARPDLVVPAGQEPKKKKNKTNQRRQTRAQLKTCLLNLLLRGTESQNYQYRYTYLGLVFQAAMYREDERSPCANQPRLHQGMRESGAAAAVFSVGRPGLENIGTGTVGAMPQSHYIANVLA